MLTKIERLIGVSVGSTSKTKIRLNRFSRKISFVSVNLFRWPIWFVLGIMRIFGIRFFDYLFLISPGTSKNVRDIGRYCPLWISKSRAFSEAVNLFVGIIQKPKGGSSRGLIIGTFKTTEDFLRDKKLGVKFDRQLRFLSSLLDVKSIALSGQMPGLMARHGVEIKKPLVRGNKGTVFCVSETVRKAVIKHKLKIGQFQMAIVGIGYVGQLLIDYLRSLGYRVVGVDIKPRGHSVVLTDKAPQVLARSKIVVVLTPDGRDFVPYVRYLKPGSIVIDDTHPRIRGEIGRVVFYKVAVSLNGVEFFPRLPGYRKNWIPGCVVEAIIAAETEKFNGEDQKTFNQEARKLGFNTLLVK